MKSTRQMVLDIIDPNRPEPVTDPNELEIVRTKQAIDRMCHTDDGKTLLRQIFIATGFDKPTAYINPQTGEINPMRSTFTEGQRCVWVNLREWIPIDVLKEIEYPEDKTGAE